MRLKYLGYSLLAAVFMLVYGSGMARAGELKVNGFADIIFTISDEASDLAGTDSEGNPANSTEKKTDVSGEVDFEYTEGPVTFRLDLNLPRNGLEASGAGTPGPHGLGIEQAKFVWMMPMGEQMGLSLTGGAFNAPIGFEAQDAPDMYQTSHGQLFDLVPSNLAGLMLSGGGGPVMLDVYFVNEWRADDAEENSVGALLTLSPFKVASLAVGFLTSPDNAGATPTTKGDGDILDVVLSGTISLMAEFELLLAGEYLTDEHNDAIGLVASLTHNSANYPHGLTVRYDSVDCDALSIYCGAKATPTSLTVAANVALSENLFALLEWRSNDPDQPLVDSTNLTTLEFVATF